MGLLDDAIRDHLELKRLRGEDPGVLDPEQREALNAVLSDESSGGQEDSPPAPAGLLPEADGETTPAGPTPPGDPDTTLQTVRGSDFSNVAEETAELDMRTVLGGDDGAAPGLVSPDGLSVGSSSPAPPSTEDGTEDSLEWEVPDEPSGKPPADLGQHVPYTQGP
jgi:hypothetical protein